MNDLLVYYKKKETLMLTKIYFMLNWFDVFLKRLLVKNYKFYDILFTKNKPVVYTGRGKDKTLVTSGCGDATRWISNYNLVMQAASNSVHSMSLLSFDPS